MNLERVDEEDRRKQGDECQLISRMRIAEGRRIIRANLKIKQFIFQYEDARIIEREREKCCF